MFSLQLLKFFFNPLFLRFMAGIVFFIGSFSAGWVVKSWQVDGQYKDYYEKYYEHALAEVKTQALANQALAETYQNKVAFYQKQMDVLNGQVKNEIAQHSIYGQCNMPDSGVQLINSAVDSANKIASSQ